MPPPFLTDAEHWRQRAREMQLLARDVRDAEARDLMQRIASDYEKLAVRALGRCAGAYQSAAGATSPPAYGRQNATPEGRRAL
jgi:hypothetical protein